MYCVQILKDEKIEFDVFFNEGDEEDMLIFMKALLVNGHVVSAHQMGL